MTTALVYDPAYLKHETGHHPENPERLRVIISALQQDEALWTKLGHLAPRQVSDDDIMRCHSYRLIEQIRSLCERGVPFVDLDTAICAQSFEVAKLAAGAATIAVDEVFNGASNAIALVRPPGHHATSNRAMGFCLFNNVGVAARYAQKRYKEVERVAILDWDVHHGNGTQGIFYDDPSVFYFSMHQYPWYPGTGSRGETGQGRGRGYTLNVPLRALTPTIDQRRAFDSAIEEIAARFTPDLVIISAGFDAHADDPLGQLLLTDEDFVQMTRVVKQWADETCGGRIISCLEGGYNLETLGETVRSHVRELQR